MNSRARTTSLVAIASLLSACCAQGTATKSTATAAPAAEPSAGESSLPAQGGWRASLVLDNGPGVGVWTVGVLKVFAQYACPEIVGIDDRGRCHVLWSYSGKWTPVTTLADGKWLGGLALADVDPRVDGRELYTGSEQGNLYEVVPYRNTLLDNRLVGMLPGREIHTVAAADVDAAHPGLELLVFTNPGGLYVAAPRTDGRDGFDVRLVEELTGRIRDAVVLGDGVQGPVEIATIGRHGKLELLGWRDGRPAWETVFETPMGLGRVAQKPAEPGDPLVLYSTADDGMIRRHARGDGGAWTHEIVYVGPPGPRGVAAGRFDADPAVETIAVFGYSREVELLTRRQGRWTREVLFTDRDKGHWLARGEVDSRNGTDELVCSGYSGRIVLLARPPGYALDAPAAARLPAQGTTARD